MLCERKRSKTVKLIYDCKCIERDKKKYLEPMLDYNDWRNKLAVIFRKKPGYISNKEHFASASKANHIYPVIPKTKTMRDFPL